MAENVAVTTLEIRGTEKVATTMKELKAQIQAYRDELVALGQVEDKDEKQKAEQVRIISELQKSTKLLSDVTNAHKKSLEDTDKVIDAQVDSYNALQAEMTKLKKAYKEMTAAERESPLGKETLSHIAALDSSLKDIDASMGQYQRNVGNYGNTFSQSMGTARQNAGYAAQGIGTLNTAIMMLGIKNDTLTKTIAGVMLAMQLLQNEGVTKLVTKLYEMIAAKIAAKTASIEATAAAQAEAAAMNATAAATTGATAATNGFKAALVSTGIGAIVVALGVLIANWDKVSKALGISKKATEEETEALKKAREAAEEFNNNVGTAISGALSQFVKLQAQYRALRTDFERKKWIKENASAFGDLGISVKDLNSAEAAFVKNTKVVVDSLIKRAMATAKEQQLVSMATQYMAARLRGDEYVKKNQVIAGQEVKSPGAGGFTTEGGKMQVNHEGKWVYTAKGAELANATVTSNAYAEANKIKGEMDALANELATKYKNVGGGAIIGGYKPAGGTTKKDAAEKESANTEKAYEDASIAEEEAYYDAEIARMEAVQEKKDEFFQRDIARMDAEREAEEEAAEFQKAIDEEEDKRQEEILENKKKRAKAAMDITTAGLSALSGMLDAIGEIIESTEKDEEKAAQKTKGLKIASTTIETLSGAATAIASAQTLGPIAGPIIGGINAAAVLATGFANIAKIKATPTNGSESSSISGVSASVSAPNIATQLDSVRTITTASEEDRLNQMASPQKVYILQSDIEAANKTSKVQVDESSF